MIVFRSTRVEVHAVQPVRVACGHCGKHFVYLGVYSFPKSILGLPFISLLEGQKEQQHEQLQRAIDAELREVTPIYARTYCPYCQYPFPASGASPLKSGASRPEAVTDERFRAGKSIDDTWDLDKFVRREWYTKKGHTVVSLPLADTTGDDPDSTARLPAPAWSPEASARGAGRLLWLVLGLAVVFVAGLVVFSVFGH